MCFQTPLNLGSSEMSVRLGGIHSLARIARSSRTDYFPVIQVLAGFLRTRYGAGSEQRFRLTHSFSVRVFS